MLTIFLLNDKYVDKDLHYQEIKDICKENNFRYIERETETKIIRGSFDTNDHEEVIFGIGDQEYFDDTYNKYFIKNMGCIMYLEYRVDENFILVIIKELLKRHPNFIVYTEDSTPDSVNYLAFDKKYFDNSKQEDAYLSLHTLPEDEESQKD